MLRSELHQRYDGFSGVCEQTKECCRIDLACEVNETRPTDTCALFLKKPSFFKSAPGFSGAVRLQDKVPGLEGPPWSEMNRTALNWSKGSPSVCCEPFLRGLKHFMLQKIEKPPRDNYRCYSSHKAEQRQNQEQYGCCSRKQNFTCAVSLHAIPNITIEVVVAG